jgi:predicted nuclease of predicted toxin-antitoxin system
MKLLLDQRLPRSTVLCLRNQEIEAVHVGDRGLATASDSQILDVGRQEGMVVVTLDADFDALLALSGVTGPSVIHIRAGDTLHVKRFRVDRIANSLTQPRVAVLARVGPREWIRHDRFHLPVLGYSCTR